MKDSARGGGGGGVELLTCPYPLKVQACPQQDNKTGSPVQGLEAGGRELANLDLSLLRFSWSESLKVRHECSKADY